MPALEPQISILTARYRTSQTEACLRHEVDQLGCGGDRRCRRKTALRNYSVDERQREQCASQHFKLESLYVEFEKGGPGEIQLDFVEALHLDFQRHASELYEKRRAVVSIRDGEHSLLCHRAEGDAVKFDCGVILEHGAEPGSSARDWLEGDDARLGPRRAGHESELAAVRSDVDDSSEVPSEKRRQLNCGQDPMSDEGTPIGGAAKGRQ